MFGNNNYKNDASESLNTYKLDLILRPGGKVDLGYLSGFADCLCAVLKVKFGAIGRQFGKNPQGHLICSIQMDADDDQSESETAQFVVDTVEKSSLPFEQFDIAIDGKPLKLIHEK